MRFDFVKLVTCSLLTSLAGCADMSRYPNSGTLKKISDAKSQEKKGNAYGTYLQERWTSESFEVLRASKYSVPVQKVELMLLLFPMVKQPYCGASELLEVVPIQENDQKKEKWTARICDQASEMVTNLPMDAGLQ